MVTLSPIGIAPWFNVPTVVPLIVTMFVSGSIAVTVDIPELLIFGLDNVSFTWIPLTLASLIVLTPVIAVVATPTVIVPAVNSKLLETGINDRDAYNLIWFAFDNFST